MPDCKRRLVDTKVDSEKMRFETDRLFFRQKTESDELVLFIHGKGGNAEEAEYYRQFVPGKGTTA